MNRTLFLLILWAMLLLLGGCAKDAPIVGIVSDYPLDLPDHFPPPPVPEDNPLTQAKVDLGRQLFFDKALSLDSTVSCASCHLQAHGFADPRQFSLGVNGLSGARNAPAIINLAYGKSFFWDGANPALESQALFPIEAEFEMANTFPEVMRRLNGDPEYVVKFREAFGREPDTKGLTQAIASFERVLLSANSRYDQYVTGNADALSESEKRGLSIFNSERAECFHCHGSFNFTNESFENNGLYEVYQDVGRWIVTGQESDIGKFKVPTLRNIAQTAPYMHDGHMQTLEEVVDHYVSGGKNHPNKSVLIRRFYLEEQEKRDLVNFLKALSDEEFLNNPEFHP